MSHLNTTAPKQARGMEQWPNLFSQEVLSRNPVFLISGNRVSCGATTVAKYIGEQVVAAGFEVNVVKFGDMIRRSLGATTDAELVERQHEAPDPRHFDAEIYKNLPPNQVCVVEGNLATTIGPWHLPEERPKFTVKLTTDPITGAIRSMQSGGTTLSKILTAGGQELLETLKIHNLKTSHDKAVKLLMKEDATEIKASSHLEEPGQPTLPFPSETPRLGEGAELLPLGTVPVKINTNAMCEEEILDYLSGEPEKVQYGEYVPEWELAALTETLATLSYLNVHFRDKGHSGDRDHFNFQYTFADYNINRLKTTRFPSGIELVRKDIKKALVDCWFGLMMKQVPRFFNDSDGEIHLDTISGAWTPEYYKIAEAWPVLKSLLSGKKVLDPFGGAGTLINLLAARDIIKNAVLSDISYAGGQPVDDAGKYTYATELNAQMSHVLFDNLPSWYKPDLTIIKERVQADARDLSRFQTDQFDYVITDPPYGKNHGSGGLGLAIGCLPEFMRVAKEGVIMLVPIRSTVNRTDWPTEIKNAGFCVESLTMDVSGGHSNFPVCYILIRSGKV